MQEIIAYRSTPHLATGLTPCEDLMGQMVRTKLGYKDRSTVKTSELDVRINLNDESYKKLEEQSRGHNVKVHHFVAGDYVLMKSNKWSTYEPTIIILHNL